MTTAIKLRLGDKLIYLEHCGKRLTRHTLYVNKVTKNTVSCHKGGPGHKDPISLELRPNAEGGHPLVMAFPYDSRSIAFPIALEQEALAEYTKRGGK